MNHYEDRAINLHLLKNHPKRFFEVYEKNITAKIRCRLLNVGLIQQIDNTMTHLFEGLRCAVEIRIQQNTLSSTKEIVEEELNKLLDNDSFLLDNSIPLLIFKHRADILQLTKKYSRSKFVILNHSFRRWVYHALQEELTEIRAHKTTLSASIGMILKATISSDWLNELNNQEDIKLLHDYDNRLVEKYQPVIQIKTQRLIDSSEMTKEDIRSDVTLMLLEKIRKGSLSKSYKHNGTVYAYLNTIIQRDIYTAFKKQCPKIETESVSLRHDPALVDAQIRYFEGNDELKHHLDIHARTLDNLLTEVCKNEEITRRFKFILAMMYNADKMKPDYIKSLYPDCKQDTIEKILKFAEQDNDNRTCFFEFMTGILARIERTQKQKSDSFRKNYERKEDKIWSVFADKYKLNFNRRANIGIEYFADLVNHYFEHYLNKNTKNT